MAIPSEKLAQSLEILRALQDKGLVAIPTGELTRTHRERLIKNGFLQEVMKGWYLVSRPDEQPGESTAWYTSFWGFCAGYLECRFGDDWCLSPEQSLSIHVGHWIVPTQLLVRAPKGGNKPTPLLHQTSVLDVRLSLPPLEDQIRIDGLRVMTLETALLAVAPSYFRAQPLEMRTALSILQEPSLLLEKLLSGGHSVVAGRLAGGFRNIGREKTAATIIKTMAAAGHSVIEIDPFEAPSEFSFGVREVSPAVNRLKLLWSAMRQHVIDHFPQSPGPILDVPGYLRQIEDLYGSDAYHSLSIEGYQVTTALIERVKQGDWHPEGLASDQEQVNALAARGYWQSFQSVKQTIDDVLQGKAVGVAVEDDYDEWYRMLFSPSVVAGIIHAVDLAGFRSRQVYIRQSRHTPPQAPALRELMPAFFELLQGEDNAAVRVVLGHFFFVYIHPFMDGNGRTGRFLMNVMLAAGGYPWIVVPVDRRADYMDALESASVDQDIVPLTRFLAGLLPLQV